MVQIIAEDGRLPIGGLAEPAATSMPMDLGSIFPQNRMLLCFTWNVAGLRRFFTSRYPDSVPYSRPGLVSTFKARMKKSGNGTFLTYSCRSWCNGHRASATEGSLLLES